MWERARVSDFVNGGEQGSLTRYNLEQKSERCGSFMETQGRAVQAEGTTAHGCGLYETQPGGGQGKPRNHMATEKAGDLATGPGRPLHGLGLGIPPAGLWLGLGAHCRPGSILVGELRSQVPRGASKKRNKKRPHSGLWLFPGRTELPA